MDRVLVGVLGHWEYIRYVIKNFLKWKWTLKIVALTHYLLWKKRTFNYYYYLTEREAKD